jgi:serine/threonine protein kinase
MSERTQRPGALAGTALEGAYQLTRLVGEGGMGAVYEGLQISLNRRVAVKVMARELAGSPEALARFRREVHITTRLAHPHIVQVLDVGSTPEGLPFLVMEYLEGEDLERRLRRVRRLPLPRVMHVVRQAVSALAATHRKGIVHRDLKPGNIFLLEAEGISDFVKVVDFGISKSDSAGAAITDQSMMLGTPKYMAPEQVVGKSRKVDHRADQWALACIAWEALAGREPFRGRDVTALLYQVVHGEPPSLLAEAPEVPPAVEEVLRKALSRKPGERYPQIAAFWTALSAAAEPELSTVTSTAPVVQPSPVLQRAAAPLRSATQWMQRRLVKPPPTPPKAGMMALTRALGKRALDELIPRRKEAARRKEVAARRRKRLVRRVTFLVAIGAGLALGVVVVRAGVPLHWPPRLPAAASAR